MSPKELREFMAETGVKVNAWEQYLRRWVKKEVDGDLDAMACAQRTFMIRQSNEIIGLLHDISSRPGSESMK